MKKLLSVLLALTLVVTGVLAMSFTTHAAPPDFVDETYEYRDATDEYGQSASMLGGLWSYEYRDDATGTFAPMGHYFASAPEGAVQTWSGYWATREDAAYETSAPDCYCSIGSNGNRMHPGTGASSVIAFTAPATGVISFDAAMYTYGSANNDDGSATKGTIVSVYVNDTRVFPASGEPDNVVYYTAAGKSEPNVISVESFNVNAGDKVRLVATARGGSRTAKGVDFVAQPVVTYHSAKKADGSEMPVGDPNGVPPSNIITSDRTATGVTVSWEKAKNAVAYNVYVGEQKMNSEPITELSFVITGLQPDTMYDSLTVTSLTADGKESIPSDAQSFKTKKGEATEDTNTGTGTGTGDSTGASTNDSSDATTNVGSSAAPSATDEKPVTNEGGFPWWIIVVVGVAVLAVAAVVVFVILGKKKKPAEGASEETSEENK